MTRFGLNQFILFIFSVFGALLRDICSIGHREPIVTGLPIGAKREAWGRCFV